MGQASSQLDQVDSEGRLKCVQSDANIPSETQNSTTIKREMRSESRQLQDQDVHSSLQVQDGDVAGRKVFDYYDQETFMTSQEAGSPYPRKRKKDKKAKRKRKREEHHDGSMNVGHLRSDQRKEEPPINQDHVTPSPVHEDGFALSQLTVDDIASDEDGVASLYREFENEDRKDSLGSQAEGMETDATSPFDFSIDLNKFEESHDHCSEPKVTSYRENARDPSNEAGEKRKHKKKRKHDKCAANVEEQQADQGHTNRGYTPEQDRMDYNQALEAFDFDAADSFEHLLGTDTPRKRKRRSRAVADTVNEGDQEPDTGGYTPEKTPELDFEAFNSYFANRQEGADIFEEHQSLGRSPKRPKQAHDVGHIALDEQSELDLGGIPPLSEFDRMSMDMPMDQSLLDPALLNADHWDNLPDDEQLVDSALLPVNMGGEDVNAPELGQRTINHVNKDYAELHSKESPSKLERVSKESSSPSKSQPRKQKAPAKFHVAVPPYVSPYPIVEAESDGGHQSPSRQHQATQRADGLFSSRVSAPLQRPSSRQNVASDQGNGSENNRPHSAQRKSTEIVRRAERSPSPACTQRGPYSQREITKLEDFRDEYLIAEDMDGYQFNEMIHAPMRGNPKVYELWAELRSILPNRNGKQLTKMCRRRFHNFHARGVWTAEEDEMLATAVEELGKSWKVVGERIERHPEDCRDRYRNYIVNADKRNHERWTDAEVQNLAVAIDHCLYVIRHDQKVQKAFRHEGRSMPDSEDESEQERVAQSLVNWQAVSDRMGHQGGGRSRLQCSMKWAQLKQAMRKMYLGEARQARHDPSTSQLDTTPKKGHGSSGWRLRKGIRRAGNMKMGDKQDLLLALSTCSAVEEQNIPWRTLGSKEFNERWTSHDKRGAWLKLRANVSTADEEDYHEVANRLYTANLMTTGEGLEDRWDPVKDEDISQPLLKDLNTGLYTIKRNELTPEERKARAKERERKKTERKREKRKARKAESGRGHVGSAEKGKGITKGKEKPKRQSTVQSRGALSKEFVGSSDEEDDQEGVPDSQPGGRQPRSGSKDNSDTEDVSSKRSHFVETWGKVDRAAKGLNRPKGRTDGTNDESGEESDEGS